MILNLTQHNATPEQISSGVVDVPEMNKSGLRSFLTFTWPLSEAILLERAAAIRHVGGAPYFMPYLSAALRARGIRPAYSFTDRVSVETTGPDGTVTKTSVFKHLGFVMEMER